MKGLEILIDQKRKVIAKQVQLNNFKKGKPCKKRNLTIEIEKLAELAPHLSSFNAISYPIDTIIYPFDETVYLFDAKVYLFNGLIHRLGRLICQFDTSIYPNNRWSHRFDRCIYIKDRYSEFRSGGGYFGSTPLHLISTPMHDAMH